MFSFLAFLKTRSEALSKITLVSLVFVPSILITFVIAGYWTERIFPWWTDGGTWLKHANAILGEAYPLWEEGTYQYPPIFFIFLAAIVKLTWDPLFSIKLLALISFFIYPLAMCLLSKEVFRSLFAGVVAAWLTAFFPLFLEFVGWGGYPNVLGFALLSVAFYFTIRFIEEDGLRNGILAAIFTVVVVLTHHLTSLILVGVLALWTVFSIGFRGVERKQVATLLIVALSAFLIYRLMYAWPLDFTFFNEAAFHRLRLVINTYYAFKSPVFLALFMVAFLVSIPILVRAKAVGFKLRFVTAWILTPLIGTQGYLFQIALDYNRIFFFVYQPVLLLAFAVALLINTGEIIGLFRRRPFKSFKQIGYLAPVIIVVLLVTTSALNGITTVENINSWYNSIDPYGDDDKFEAVAWLTDNSKPQDVIVAEEPIGRWIEGLSKRRVLIHTPPRFLFMEGEVEREYAARSLLVSQYGIKSRDVWILEQSPFGYLSPMIAFYHLGDYVNTVFLSTKDSYVSVTESSERAMVTFADLIGTQVKLLSGEEPALVITRKAGPVKINEVTSLSRDQTISLTFNLESNVKIENVALTFNFTSEAAVGRDDYYIENPYTLNVLTEMGELKFVGNNPIELTCLSRDYVQFTLAFENQTSFKLEIQLMKIESSSGIETYTWKEIADKYSVKYVVLPKLPIESGTSLSTMNTPTEYSHLLRAAEGSTALEVAREYKRVIILEYVGSD